jgi:transcription elongation factor GreB
VSPLARALLGARVGQTVTWKRPIGDLVLTVEHIEYR